MKLDLQGNNGNLVYRPSIKSVRILRQIEIEICEVFHWDGLLLCVIKGGRWLLVWNPYLRQTRWIRTGETFHRSYTYGLGYENNNKNRNHKILRLLDVAKPSKLGPVFEIYDLNSNSWRVLDVNPGSCDIESGLSLKGNTYFVAAEETWFEGNDLKGQCFLLCFDFTAERFGQRLVLPFGACVSSIRTVVLSSVRDEQLAVLHHRKGDQVMEIWITTKIEPDAASWSRFLRVELRPRRFVTLSFFIDEEKKLALVSGICYVGTTIHKRAYIIKEHGNIEEMNIGKAREPGNILVFSSYAPSLAQLQINGRGKRKERDY
ncbi:F-box/kelch-repeat protein [Raphanus sativus]|nr:F-box/kelch-repeat protein [Raphanus sativus]KAJ4897742.1 F-box/kelch-repeat protein [Raphanus sativus]